MRLLCACAALAVSLAGGTARAQRDELPAPPPAHPQPPAEKKPPERSRDEVPPLPPSSSPSPPATQPGPPPLPPAAPPPIQPAAPPPIQPAVPPPPQPAAPPAVPALPAKPVSCQPPPGWKGPFTPPPGCTPSTPQAQQKPESLSHGGQFVLQLSILEIPYLFNPMTRDVPPTPDNPLGKRGNGHVGWMPTLGLGFGSGSSEFLVKFGGGVQSYLDDTAFVFGIERRHYFGSSVFKGIFFWNVMFAAGREITFYQLFNLGVGFQIDPSRRYGFYAMFGPGFVSAWGAGSNDVSFILSTHFGFQLRL